MHFCRLSVKLMIEKILTFVNGKVNYECKCIDIEFYIHHRYGIALEDGDMALLDMGAEYHFYGSDITCSFPMSLATLLVK